MSFNFFVCVFITLIISLVLNDFTRLEILKLFFCQQFDLKYLLEILFTIHFNVHSRFIVKLHTAKQFFLFVYFFFCNFTFTIYDLMIISFSSTRKYLISYALGDQKELRGTFSYVLKEFRHNRCCLWSGDRQSRRPSFGAHVETGRRRGVYISFLFTKSLNFSYNCYLCALYVCRWLWWTDCWLNRGFVPGLRRSDGTAFHLLSLEHPFAQ